MHSNSSETKPVKIEIDSKSGFCFGVSRAVKLAEEQLNKGKKLYSLGEIVHNEEEIQRLHAKGMKTALNLGDDISEKETVLFRAHGEPPSTYEKMKKKGACVIDATCPVVLKLQKRVKEAWLEMKSRNGQLVIYGKMGHAEVTGLAGQCNGEAIVVENFTDIKNLHPDKPTVLFSQTTMSYAGLNEIEEAICNYLSDAKLFKSHKTICAQVGNRIPHLQQFAANYDLILFVAGTKSSNGKFLFETCKTANSRTYYINSPDNLKQEWLTPKPESIGVCGATSTPQWLMEKVAEATKRLLG